jgi:hypothetical protein
MPYADRSVVIPTDEERVLAVAGATEDSKTSAGARA